jgi:hypothetical protein
MTARRSTARRAERPDGPGIARNTAARADVGLAFMLARQGMTRLRFDADRLQQFSRGKLPHDPAMILMEAELGQHRTRALTERLRPFTRSRDLSVRFEAQELLVALDRVNEVMDKTVRLLRPTPRRHPAQVEADLRAKLG